MSGKLKIFKQKFSDRSIKKGCGCSNCKDGKTCNSATSVKLDNSNPKDALIEELLGSLLSTDRQGVLNYLEGLKQDGSG